MSEKAAGNGDTFLIFTTREGGQFKGRVTEKGQIQQCSEAEFEKLRETGKLNLREPRRDYADVVEPVFIILARVEQNYDFHLGRSR